MPVVDICLNASQIDMFPCALSSRPRYRGGQGAHLAWAVDVTPPPPLSLVVGPEVATKKAQRRKILRGNCSWEQMHNSPTLTSQKYFPPVAWDKSSRPFPPENPNQASVRWGRVYH